MKRIFFIKPLIEKLRSENPPKVTFRTRRKRGLYMVCSGGRFHPKEENIRINVWSSNVVYTKNLTDQDAQDAGIDDLKELLELFRKWYGEVPAKMYKNCFVVVESRETQALLQRKVKVGCLT